MQRKDHNSGGRSVDLVGKASPPGRMNGRYTEALNAMINMKATYMKFKMDSLLALINQIRKSG